MKKNQKSRRWTKFRHRIVRNIAFLILAPYSYIKYGLRVKKFKEQKKGQPYLILFNHETEFDQFFVGMAFRGPVYYIASEDLFSNGFVSKLIKYLVAPIPIKKQTADIRAIMNSIKVAKEGGTIAVSPEGNRTYSGKTGYMNPTIAPLARKLGMPVVLYRIEGGYGVSPRWSNSVRRGRINCYVHSVIEPEEYSNLSDAEFISLIEKGLYVDESAPDGSVYYSKKSAEHLERVFYVCPDCGLASFESKGDTVRCKCCGRGVRYLPDKRFVGDGFDFKYSSIGEWYDAQCNFINSFDVTEHTETPLFSDRSGLSEVIVYNKKERLADDAEIRLFGDRIEIKTEKEEMTFSFCETAAVTVLGRNKINIYHGGKIYQLKSSKSFNALKYVNIYNRFRNISKGDKDGKFLGL
jgi:1-acyl-sn-glycerol-3-phosphate acyltransferase